jgi:hypothetical protein
MERAAWKLAIHVHLTGLGINALFFFLFFVVV